MAARDIVKKLQDMTSIEWSERATSSGTAGTYLKARTGAGARSTYYKLARFNGIEIDGFECVNELVASRLMEILGVEHLPYRLIHARVSIDDNSYETWLNSSQSFRKAGERKLALGSFFEMYRKNDETPWEFCKRFGWDEQVRQMMLVDYLIINRDRHSSNTEVLIDRDGTPRLAPIFDSGLSLLAPFAGDEERIASFNPLKPVATTNFIGSRSLEENLERAVPVPNINPLREGHRTQLLEGLDDILSRGHLDKIWGIIWTRWKRYEDIRDRRQ